MREQRTIGNRWADLIRHGYEALGRGEIEPLVSLLHDHAEWQGLPQGFRGHRTTCRGRDEISDALRTLVVKCELNADNWHVGDVIQAGDFAAATFSWRTPAGTVLHHAHIPGQRLRRL